MRFRDLAHLECKDSGAREEEIIQLETNDLILDLALTGTKFVTLDRILLIFKLSFPN